MDINYELIIKYLVKKNQPQDTFITEKNVLNYSINFPEKFKNIFGNKFYRFGIKIIDNEKNNVSFWSSLLTLISKEFMIPYNNDEIVLINQFKTQVLENKLNKNDLQERFKLDPDIIVLQFIVDSLDINFIIFDFATQNIFSVYPTAIINPLKQTLLFAKYNNIWEPIMVNDDNGNIQRLFSYNDEIIKKLLNESEINYFENDKINKDFIFTGDINSIIQKELDIISPPEKVSTDNSSDNGSVHTETSESENQEIVKINKTKLNKMKLGELKELVQKLKIAVSNKNPTRAFLIELINNKINTKN